MDEVALEITVPDELETGVYANVAIISSQTPHDFTLDFVQILPVDEGEAPKGKVVARLKLAPSFLMPLLSTLSNHLAQYEEKMREIKEQGEGEAA